MRVRGMLCFIGHFPLAIERRDLVLSLGPWPEGKGHAVHVGSPLWAGPAAWEAQLRGVWGFQGSLLTPTNDLTHSAPQPVPYTSPRSRNTLSSIQRCEVTSLGWGSRAQILLLLSIQVLDRAEASPGTSCPLSPR